MILQERPLDSSMDGFHKWKFMSVHSWGEKPAGTWKVKVRDMVSEILQRPSGSHEFIIILGNRSLLESTCIPYYTVDEFFQIFHLKYFIFSRIIYCVIISLIIFSM